MNDRISIDTRTIQPGDVFIPVGEGINYCDEAKKKGATVLNVNLTDYAIEKRSKYTGIVIGITGSFGKTTLKDTLSAAFSSQGVSATEKNFNNEIGVPLTIANADLSAPYWIIEMGIRRPGDMSHLASIVQPNIAVLSGFGYTHMEFYKHDLDLLKEKLCIIQNSTSTLFIPSNILLKDDIYKLSKPVEVIECNVDTLIDTNIAMTQRISDFFKLDPIFTKKSIELMQRSPHRLNEIKLQNHLIILDDSYNSNPIAVKFAVEYCDKYYKNLKTLIVLGDMEELGQNSLSLHKETYDWVISQPIVHSLITFGKRFNSSPINFSQKEGLINYIFERIDQFDLILFKGSRSNQLDQAIEYLIELSTK